MQQDADGDGFGDACDPDDDGDGVDDGLDCAPYSPSVSAAPGDVGDTLVAGVFSEVTVAYRFGSATSSPPPTSMPRMLALNVLG